MQSKQPSTFLYTLLGLVAIVASLLIGILVFRSRFFEVKPSETGLLLIGIIYGVSIVAIAALVYWWQVGPERARAQQSHQMLTIANNTMAYLRKGFSPETAERVAEIIYGSTDADAVALTNNRSIVAFVGFAQDYHRPGDDLLYSSDRLSGADAIKVFRGREDAGCPDNSGVAWSGIAVPLAIQERTIGTLEFLYVSPKRIAESRLTVARGLGKLLSTQLELSELDKQKELAFRSELKALRAQINPHFLFNTLNTIAALCRTDPAMARRLIIKFADFFRESLERQTQFITLEEELRYVNSYLVFEQARFGAKLQIDRHIEREARRVRLPSLVLQPLVENAIKHGMAKNGPLHLQLEARLNTEHLIVSVRDDGVGMNGEELPAADSSGQGRGLGIGLSNVRDRLRSLYGSAELMDIVSRPGVGTEVKLLIPLAGGTYEA